MSDSNYFKNVLIEKKSLLFSYVDVTNSDIGKNRNQILKKYFL